MTVWYRYNDTSSVCMPPYLQEIPVVRATPKGVWLDEWGKLRFVLNVAHKRYAYPTVELALNSYIHRKIRQIQHAANTHDRATEYLAMAKRMQRGEPPIDLRSIFQQQPVFGGI